MKAKFSNVLYGKIAATIFGVALILFGMCFAGNNVSKVYAASTLDTTTYADYAFKTYTGTEAKEYVGLKAPNAEEGYVFAGWYTKATCKLEEAVKSNASVENSDSVTYYAKYVPEDVLSIRLQVSTKEDVNTEVDGNQRNMRVVSSVDTLNYSQVGFRLKYKEDNLETNPWIYKKNTADIVYERIESATEGDEYKFSPKVVDTKSQYFMTATWKGDDNTGISESDFDTNYYIRAYWVTLDGMTVYGPTRYVSVDDGLDTNIVNVSVKNSAWNEESTLTTDAYTGATVSVAYQDGTYAHLRINLGEGVNRANVLKSLTKFTITNTGDSSTETAYYRNLYTKYTETTTNDVTTNTADESWYKAYADSNGNITENEFVIATAADLYGLSKMTLPSNGLSGKKIYMVADIEANKGRATESGWDSEQTSDGQTITDGSGTAYEWTPIGGSIQFKGTFDGQGHSISGIYINSKTTVNTGLFASGNVTTTIKNLELINSFYSTSASRAGGFIGYGSGTYKSLRSAVILKTSAGNAGGIIGQVNVDTAYLDDCCFDGTLIATAGTGYGGMIGYSGCHVTIQNCLNKGTMNIANACNRIGGFIGRAAAEKTYQIVNSLMATTIQGTTNRGTLIGNVENASGLVKVSGTYAIQDADVTSQAVNAIGSNSSTNISNDISCSLMAKTKLQGYIPWYYENTTLDFEEYWCLVENSTPELKSFAENPLHTLEGHGSATEPWMIYTVDELKLLATLAEETFNFSDKYLQLGDHITVVEGDTLDAVKDNYTSDDNWKPIGTSTNPFAGTFDGNKKTISGIYLETSSQFGGLFSTVATADGSADATIKNLNLVNSYFEFNGNGNAYIGSIAGSVKGNLYGVSSDATVYSSGLYTAGLVAQMAGSGILDSCWFKGRVDLETNKCQYAAGLIASIAAGTDATVHMQHCLNSGTIAGERTDSTILGLSGLCSYVYSGNLAISDSLHAGIIEGTGTRRTYLIARGETLVTCENTYYCDDQELDHAIWGDSCTKDNGTIGLSQRSMVGLAAILNKVNLNESYWAIVKGNTPQLKCFGNKTDVELWQGEGTKTSPWIISTAEELKVFAEASQGYKFSGNYIKLGDSINVNMGSENWTPIGNANIAFAGNFDGNNKIISGINYQGDGTYIGFFGHVGATGSVSNLTLANSSFSTTNTGVANIGAIVGRATGGTYTKIKVNNDVTVKSAGVCNGGIAGSAWGGNATFNNCWFAGTLKMLGETGRQGGAIVGRSYGGGRTIVIEHCLNTGNISSATTEENKTPIVGGLCGHLKDATLKISDSLNANCVESQYTYDGYIGAVIGWVESGTYELKQVYGIDEVKDDSEKYHNHPIIGTDNGTLSIDSVDYEVIVDTKMIGNEAWFNMHLDYEKYWNPVQEAIPELQCFASGSTVLAAWSGKGTEQSPWIISTKAELVRLSTLSQTYNFSEKYIQLGTDEQAGELTITVNEGTVDEIKKQQPENWVAIGSNATEKQFAGTFDGNYNTISGLYYVGSSSYAGLFASTADSATIKNLEVVNSYFSYTGDGGNAFIGGVVGCLRGTCDNVKSSAEIASVKPGVGGIAGVASYSGGNTTITNCWFAGTISLSSAATQAGGILGQARPNSGYTVQIEDCLNTGTISGALQVGGICGAWNWGDEGSLQIKSCLNAKKIDCSKGNTGSIIGRVQKAGLILENCYTTYESEADITKFYGGTSEGVEVTEKICGIFLETELKGRDGWYKTTLDFGTRWSVVEGQTPQLSNFVTGKKLAVLGGRGTEASPWIITNGEELIRLSELSQTYTFADKFIRLGTKEDAGKLVIKVNEGNSIDEVKANADGNWQPIARSNYPFAGTFDGNNNTISGIYYQGDGTAIGMFTAIGASATVKNFKLINSYFESTYVYSGSGDNFASIGSIAGLGYGILEGIKSEAEVVCHYTYGGGLVGGTRGYDNLTLKDCWFDGTLRVEGAQGAMCGGILGGTRKKDADVTIIMEDCLNSGTILVSALNTNVARVGGICGYVDDNMTLTNCLNAKSFVTTRERAAAIIGEANSGSNVTLENVYAITGDGDGINDETQNEQPYGTYNQNEHCGYIASDATVTVLNDSWAKVSPENLAGENARTSVANLFGEGTHWLVGDLYPVLNILGEQGVAIPTMAVANAKSTMTRTLTGDGNYVTQVTQTTPDEYTAYLTSLEEAGFDKHAENNITDTVLSATYARGNLILTTTYFKNENRTSISYYEGPISEHLKCDEADVNATDVVANTSLSMLEMFHYGNSFVIQLKNGHFIVNDGGMNDELIYLIEYMEELAGKTDGVQNIPVIEAWFISHAHGDHTGAFNSFWDAGKRELVNRVYVEGVYYSSPSDEQVLKICGCESMDFGIAKVVNCLLRTQFGEPTPLYRPQTGQRYYFNDTTIDILLAQEQLTFDGSDGARANLNSSSTVCLFTSENQTCLLSGDLQEEGFDILFANYDAPMFSTLNFFALNHHGFNTSSTIAANITAKTILKTVKDVTPIRCKTAIETLCNKATESVAWGNGTVVFTFPYAPNTDAPSYTVLPQNSWAWKDSTEPKYHETNVRKEQPNINSGVDGTMEEEFE